MEYLWLKIKASRVVAVSDSKSTYYPIQSMIEEIVPINFTENGEHFMQLIKETCRGSIALPTMVEALQIVGMNVPLLIQQNKINTSYTKIYDMKKSDSTGVKLSIAVKKFV